MESIDKAVIEHWRNFSLINLTEVIDGVTYVEEWGDISGYKGFYMASTFGRIKSLKRLKVFPKGRFIEVNEKILKPSITKKGYLRVCLSKNGVTQKHFIHKLVALVFIPNPKNIVGVNHTTYNKKDNRVSKLEWMNSIDNAKDAWANGKVPYKVGFDASNVSFTREQVIDIYNSKSTVQALCDKYKRPYMTIYSIKSGRVFKEITNGVSSIVNQYKKNGFNRNS